MQTQTNNITQGANELAMDASASMPLVFSVTSGKGGVGKTNISANLAYCLARMGKKVVVLDADLGLANVDIVLGLTPKLNLFHLFHEGAHLTEILCPTPYGFSILPASSGVSEMLALDTGQKLELLEAMDGLEQRIDYLLVDTGAGINDSVVYFNLAAQERVVVVTPEPTSITDAYALIKVLKLDHGVEHFKILLNMVPDEKTAREIFVRLYRACDRFLDSVSLDLVGFIPQDRGVRNAVVEQTPFCHLDPAAPASQAVMRVAENLQHWDVSTNLDGNIKFFWKRLLFR